MIDLQPEDYVDTVPELEIRIGVYQRKLESSESELLEIAAARNATTDRDRRAALAQRSSALNEQISDWRAIISRLRRARRQVIDDEALRARGGVPYGPIWPIQTSLSLRPRIRNGGTD
jgi:hypothetical protein